MQLLRALGVFHVSMILFSATLGTGIFVTPKAVLKYSSLNIPVSLSIWAGCGLLSIMSALCNAEIATTYPLSGASYYFLKRTLGSSVAFLSLWIKLFAHFLGIGAQCLLIATSVIQCFYSGCPAPELPTKCLALAILWSFGIVSARGIKTVAWFNTVSSFIKLSVLCLISLTVLLVNGKKENVSRFENALDAELPNASQIADAILQVSYSYLGSSVLIVIADSVGVTWMNRVFPSIQWISSFLISAFLLGSVSCGIVSASRVFYSASQEGEFPSIYSMLNDHHSPAVADIQIVILSSVAIISSSIIYLVKYVSLGSFCINLLQMIGLLKIRYQNPDIPRPYKVWLPFIFGSIALSLFLIFTPVIQSPSIEHVYQVVFLFCGFLCYWLQANLNGHATCFDTITCYCQLLFNISPSEDPEEQKN
ncbi:solute carrier family 7 member 12 isoform X1 [Mus musculus]|uniref:solute carrier family 7 member 12 isoform X1 n=1 Tax=Mus musculus TaxID=10090 RepID=UPI0003D6EDA7|nr:solute carrier family 7 (cationic amino acid transporter, y+ system), member 12 isoform X1 [Mus musculus]|eukprot:XP_006530115.1 PREDICTED: solute carrier family 7 (cationic amino acid transporter, y+ system), member 12 isoform X1 [Mus musculus]